MDARTKSNRAKGREKKNQYYYVLSICFCISGSVDS